MKCWAWVGAVMGVRGSRFGRRARRQRPRLEHLEDRLPPALSIGLSTLTGTVGTMFNQQLATSGGGVNDTYSYALETAQGDPPNNGLPPGLSLLASGLLSGTPTAPGAYDIVVAVTDNTSKATTQEAFPLSISPLITLSGSLASGTRSVPVTGDTITANGPAGDTYTFTATGNVPQGLTLVKTGATTAQLQGTPTAFATYSFTVTATDPNGNTGVQAYQMTINPNITFNPAPLANFYADPSSSSPVFFNELPSAVVGQPYSQSISTSSANEHRVDHVHRHRRRGATGRLVDHHHDEHPDDQRHPDRLHKGSVAGLHQRDEHGQ